MTFSKLIWALTYFKFKKFEKACKNPESATAALWLDTKKELENGSFWRGRVHERLEDYPITDYEFYRDAIDAAYSGTISPLTGREILFWSESGGTTGKSKVYPITEEYKKSFQSTTPPFLHSLASRFPRFLSKPILYFAATLPSEKSPAGIEKGFISGFNYRNIPKLLAKKYAFPLGVFQTREIFFQWAPLYAVATDLSAMIAITPSIVEQFTKELEKNFDSYIPFLEGKKTPPSLPPVHCSPERLALLKEAFSQRPISFEKIWPSMEFICCWKTATCGLQLPRIKPCVGKIPVVDATYSATEGWITVPLSNETNGGPVHPSALIVEFLPVGGTEKDILPLWKLEPGKDYEILLTTKMGFVRFRLYDVVRCTGFFHRSPIIEFLEKAGNTVSLGHTRISETHILMSLEKEKITFSTPWILAPAQDGSGLFFYYRDEEDRVSAKVERLENTLRVENVEYGEDIRDRLLQPIRMQKLSGDHPLWNANTHAQTKPKVIQQKPI